jgi:hypothetical protein
MESNAAEQVAEPDKSVAIQRPIDGFAYDVKLRLGGMRQLKIIRELNFVNGGLEWIIEA